FFYAGCGGAPSASDVCDKSCSCIKGGCSASERKTCINSVDDLRKQADEAGCSSEFDDLLSCANGDSCKNGMRDVEPCTSEVTAVETCIAQNQPTTPCDDAGSHIEECQGKPAPPPSGMTCTGTTLCEANCINAASCQAIKDIVAGKTTPEDQPVIDCV